MRENILALKTSIGDRTLAVSISTAVVSDQNILQSIQQDEVRAEQDSDYARALDNNQEHRLATPSVQFSKGDALDETISTVMGDMMDRMTLVDDLDNGEGSSHQVSAPYTKITCVSCMDTFDKVDVFTSPCGDSLCYECTRHLFLGSIRDEELYPPRCCGHVIPPGIALRVLDYRELRDFSERALEYVAKDRVYCAEPTCSKFIPPFAISGDHGTCRECHRQTHLPCRSLAHPRDACPTDQPLQNVLAIAKQENWQRCLGCHAMVELYQGCNHMTCR